MFYLLTTDLQTDRDSVKSLLLCSSLNLKSSNFYQLIFKLFLHVFFTYAQLLDIDLDSRTGWHFNTVSLCILHINKIFMEVHKRHILFLHCTKNIIDKTSSTFKTIYNSFSDNSMFKILYLI